MFSYEENEKIVNKAIRKCICEGHEHWETNDEWVEESVNTVIGVLKKMNILRRDAEETLAAIFIENKLAEGDLYIGNDTQKAVSFVKKYIDELKEELEVMRRYRAMTSKYPNANWLE